MKQLMAVITEEKKFSERFSDYVNGSGNLSLRAVPFGSIEECVTYAKMHREQRIPLMLCDEALLREAGKYDLTGFRTVPLSDTGRGGTLSRYQSGDALVREVISLCTDMKLDCLARRSAPDTGIYAVWSPVNTSARTAFSLALARLLSGRKKTLYLNFCEFPGLRLFTGTGYERGLSNAAYYLKQGKLDGQRFAALAESINGVEYVPPAFSPEDCGMLGSADMAALVRLVSEETPYANVVADLPFSLAASSDVLELSDRIFIPADKDPLCLIQTREFMEYLSASGRSDMAAKTVPVELPESLPAGGFQSVDSLIYGPAGDLIRKAVRL